MARKLAAKCSLATRIDALSDESATNEIGIECRAALENVLRTESERGPSKNKSFGSHRHDKYEFKSETYEYDASADTPASRKHKRFDDNEESTNAIKKMKIEEVKEEDEAEPEKKKKKKEKKAKKADTDSDEE